jgi:Zn-dependent protease
MQATFKRPGWLKLVCILGFIWITFSFLFVFAPSVKKMGDWYPAIYGLLVASGFMSYIGVWHMKRWGVQLFIITFFVKESILVLVNDVNYIGVAFSVLFMIPMVAYYRRMDLNL